MGQPRRNEQRFYRYPLNRVVAIIDDPAALEAALADLEGAGIKLPDVNVLSGQTGAELLDPAGVRHGLRGRLLRLLQRGAYEGDVLQVHTHALQAGQHVIYVPVRNEDERQRAAHLLRNAGGHHLVHFRRWAVEQVR